MRVFVAREQVVERLRAVADHLQAVGHVGLGEGDAGQFDVVRVVLDQQDVFLAHARFPESGTAGSSTKKVLPAPGSRSEEHTSELQSLMRISYAVFCLKKKTKQTSERSAPMYRSISLIMLV